MASYKTAQNIRDMYLILIIVIAVSLVILWMFWSLPRLTQQNEYKEKKEDLFARQQIGILSYRAIDNSQTDRFELIIINNKQTKIFLQNITIQNLAYDLENIPLEKNSQANLNFTLGQKCTAGDYYSYSVSFGFKQENNKHLFRFPKKLEGQCVNL